MDWHWLEDGGAVACPGCGVGHWRGWTLVGGHWVPIAVTPTTICADVLLAARLTWWREVHHLLWECVECGQVVS